MHQIGGLRGTGPASDRDPLVAWRDCFLKAATALGLSLPIAAWADCNLKALELPVTMVGSGAVATVGINGKEVKLLVDSGAFFSFLTEAAAAELQLPLTYLPNGFQVYGVAGRVDVQATRVKRMQLLGGELPEVDFLVGGNEPGRGAMGLMGRNLLGFTDTEYDLAHGVIRFMVPEGDCSQKKLAYWAGSSPVSEIALLRNETTKRPALEAMASLNGKSIHVLFDTGAMSAVSLAAAKRGGIAAADMKPAGRVRGAGRGDLAAWSAPVDSFELGGERIEHSRLLVADFDLKAVDMLVGIDFFLSHRIYVSKSQRRMYLTYNGGPVFALNAVPSPAAATASDAASAGASETLADAAAYARRGAASAARRDFKHALDDLNRACDLEPQVAGHFTRRGMIYEALRQPQAALRDFEVALRLDPDAVDARLQRALLREGAKDAEGALDDLQKLDKTLAPQSHMRSEMARMYERLGRQEQALAQWNLWIAAHRNEVTLGAALNARCWARAMLNVELDQALDDCNGALDREPGNAGYLDSRAWVQLRRGRYREALADYDRALEIRPLEAWTLYGRGIARVRLGDQELGRADIDAARRARPSLEAEAARYGIVLQ